MTCCLLLQVCLRAQVPNLKFKHITSEDGLPQNTIHGIVKDRYGFMWFGTWGGLCRYDGYQFKVYRYDSNDRRSINSNRINNVLKDEKGDVWILTFRDHELCRYNYESDDFDRMPASKLPASFLKKISRDDHYDSIKYSYEGYSWHLEVPSHTFVQSSLSNGQRKIYRINPANPWTLNDEYVTEMYLDDHHLLWLGTFSNGINKANLKAKPFEYFFHDPENPNTIIDNNVKAMCEDLSGNLWVGTRDKGISVVGKTGVRHYGVTEGLKDDQIRRLFCDSKGIVWIGSKEGAAYFDPSIGEIQQVPNSKLNSSVYGINEDKQGNIWLATWNGLYKYQRGSGEWRHFDPSGILTTSHARVVLMDRRNRLWVGTEGGGLTVLEEKGDQLRVIRHFAHSNKEENTISEDRINAIYEDSKGMIWVGTGNGLDRYDPVKKTFTHFAAESGLADATIAGIVEDHHGFLWVSHKKGISQLDLRTFKVRNFTQQDGLQGNEFSDGAAYQSKTSKLLFFGGNNGFNVFRPGSIVPDQTKPKTVLTNLQILNHTVKINEETNGRVVLTRPLYLTKEIVLNAGDKSFAIEFAALHYANPQGNQYAYMLEGFDKDWINTGSDRRIANYSNLDAGEYLFKVKSSNSDGVWNPVPTELKIIVRPPFYASIWAYLLYALLLAAILWLYHYYSTRYSRLQAKLSYEQLIREKENELHDSKLRFFTNISHEIKTPLSLILAPVEKLMQLFNNQPSVAVQLHAMKASAQRLLKLVNQLLDFEKLESGNVKLRLQKGNMFLFLKELVQDFQPLADKKDIQVQMNIQEGEAWYVYDEDVLEKMMNNLISNAIKFTPPKGWIRISFEKLPNEAVKIEVSNSGKAISPGERDLIFKPFQQGSGQQEGGTGIGLAYCKSLVELHGGSIGVESKQVDASGSGENSFYLILPLKATKGEDETDLSVGKDVLSETIIAEADPDIPLVDEPGERLLLNGKLPQLLIVEDDEELRKYLESYFAAYYRVMIATDGIKGFEMAQKELPDLVISDVMMPGMNGFELCGALKQDLKTGHIPVLLLTAKSMEADVLQGLEIGADDYITKPFRLNVLSAKVKNLLLSRLILKEKYRKEVSVKVAENIPQSADEKLLQKLLQFIEDHLSDSSLNIDEVCDHVGVSRTQLYRKVKALTGLSMAEMIKEMRLKRAKQLLYEKKFNVNEVTYMVGFSDPDYFRKCFKTEFGVTPSEYHKLS